MLDRPDALAALIADFVPLATRGPPRTDGPR